MSDGADAIGWAYVTKWSVLGTSWIKVCVSLLAVQLVAAPKRSSGPELYIDVVDKQGIQFFDQSVRIRIAACSLRASWLFLTASARLLLAHPCTQSQVAMLGGTMVLFKSSKSDVQ